MSAFFSLGSLFFGPEMTPNERGMAWIGLCILMSTAIVCLYGIPRK